MIATLEIGNRLTAREFRDRERALVEPLLDAQFGLRESGTATTIVIGGMPASGRGACVDRLQTWLDTRYVTVHAMSPPTDIERSYPVCFRYWQRLPAAGRTAILYGSWYRTILHARVWEGLSDADFHAQIDRVVGLERMLRADGMQVLKFWLHLDRDAHAARLERMEANPAERWRLTPDDWLAQARWEAWTAAASELLERSNHEDAPWTIVDAADDRWRDMTVGESLLRSFRTWLDRPPVSPSTERRLSPPEGPNPLQTLVRVEDPPKKAYEDELEALQGRLGRLGRAMARMDRGLVLVLEGQDAAGKGGTIRRLAGGLESRSYRVHATSAPSPEERQYPYLWRFWRDLPRRGSTGIFDRSWYGRVLVERVEGFCSVPDWERAYDEICAFEHQLADAGFLVVKFWLAVSFEEQLARFQEREATGAKRHKLTDEDWRNRDKWGAYEDAVGEMIARTSTPDAPWIVVDSDSKRNARLTVLREVCTRLEASLGLEPLHELARL